MKLNQTINGEKEGLWKGYHPDGSISSEGHYLHGQQHGRRREYCY